MPLHSHKSWPHCASKICIGKTQPDQHLGFDPNILIYDAHLSCSLGAYDLNGTLTEAVASRLELRYLPLRLEIKCAEPPAIRAPPSACSACILLHLRKTFLSADPRSARRMDNARASTLWQPFAGRTAK